MSGDGMNAGVRYSRDRPKSCEFCYYWKGRPAGCSLGEQNCFYIIHDEKNIKEKTGRCGSCPYGKHGGTEIMKLKVEIGGDVNIYLTPDADPVSLDISEDDLDDTDQEGRTYEGLSYFESAVNILKDMIKTIGHEPDESEDADDNKIVMILAPGQKPKVATFAEADELIPGFSADYECVENFLDLGLNLYHRKNQLLLIGDNEFLIGTAVVCFEDADGDLWSLGGQDIYQVFRHMEKNHAVLSVDGKQIVALEIAGPKPEEEGE